MPLRVGYDSHARLYVRKEKNHESEELIGEVVFG